MAQARQKAGKMNIAIIGGGEFTRDLLEKVFHHYQEEIFPGRIRIVADSDTHAPGMSMARQLGIMTTTDFQECYKPEIGIDQILMFTPDEELMAEILRTRPKHIRFVAHPGMKLFWSMFQLEEQRLKAQRDELETILNGIQDGIAVIDMDYRIISANRPLMERMGYTPQDVIGHFCHEVFHHSEAPCSPPDHPCPLAEARLIDDSVNAMHIHRNLDGEERIIDLTIYPLKDFEGRINRFVEITRDVTKRYRAQEEMKRQLEEAVEERTKQLEETHRRLIQQDKMTSLGKLSASVVHELNNPLTGILTFNRLIQRILAERELDPGLIETITNNLKMMENETSRCSKIVSNLLAFARKSKMEPEEVEINSVIDQVLTLNSHHLSLNRIEVDWRPGEDLPLVFGDVNQLQQVLMNLIFNAVEAIPGERAGRLVISTILDEEAGMIAVRIRDNGTGIPQENLPHIFEPFFTTKQEGKGVGLGLSVIFGIIKEHRGQIDVEATSHEGTCFVIKLPIQRERQG